MALRVGGGYVILDGTELSEEEKARRYGSEWEGRREREREAGWEKEGEPYLTSSLTVREEVRSGEQKEEKDRVFCYRAVQMEWSRTRWIRQRGQEKAQESGVNAHCVNN